MNGFFFCEEALVEIVQPFVDPFPECVRESYFVDVESSLGVEVADGEVSRPDSYDSHLVSDLNDPFEFDVFSVR